MEKSMCCRNSVETERRLVGIKMEVTGSEKQENQ